MTLPSIQLHTFTHNNQLHLKITPAKKLFNSTLIHEVVNRGDVFALNLSTGIFTILPRHYYAGAYVVHQTHDLTLSEHSRTAANRAKEKAAEAKVRLKELVEQLKLELED